MPLAVLLHRQGPERQPPTLQGQECDMHIHSITQRGTLCDPGLS
jgi:hypothetical protein